MDSALRIKPDPSFERIRKTLLLEGKPDRLPLCDFSIDDGLKEWTLGRKAPRKEYNSCGKKYPSLLPEDEVEFWYRAGYDYVCTAPFYEFNLADVKEKEGSFSAEGVGKIRTLDDLHSRRWLWQDVDGISTDNVVDLAKVLPEDMKLIVLARDIFTCAWENMGFVNFCTSIYEEPELIEELIAQLGEAVCVITERSVEKCGNKVGAIWYADDLAFNSGTFVNPEVYRKYLFPWVRRLSKLCRSLNVPFIYHTDGNLWSIFDDFYALGVNGIHPLEPKSMDPVEVKQKQGHRFCLIGNIEVDTLSRGTPKEVEALVKDRIEKLGYNGGYCIGSSNTLPSYVKPENFKAMVETAFNYKYG